MDKHRLISAVRALALAAAVAGCGSSASLGPGATTGFGGGGRAPPTSGTSGTTGGGANGSDSLSGALAFIPEAGWATITADADAGGDSVLTAALNDGYSGCSDDGAYQALHVLVSLSDGGAPQVGTYEIGAGASVELLRGAPGALGPFAEAVSGQVTVNQLDSSQVSGNFAVSLQPVDGGAPSDLSGIFVVGRCY